MFFWVCETQNRGLGDSASPSTTKSRPALAIPFWLLVASRSQAEVTGVHALSQVKFAAGGAGGGSRAPVRSGLVPFPPLRDWPLPGISPFGPLLPLLPLAPPLPVPRPLPCSAWAPTSDLGFDGGVAMGFELGAGCTNGVGFPPPPIDVFVVVAAVTPFFPPFPPFEPFPFPALAPAPTSLDACRSFFSWTASVVRFGLARWLASFAGPLEFGGFGFGLFFFGGGGGGT